MELPDGGSISLTYPLFVCAIVLVGPTAAAVLAVVSMLPSLFITPRMTPVRMLGNLGQLILTVLIPGWAYLAMAPLGARLLSLRPIGAGDFPGMLAPLLIAATLGVFVNAALFVAGYGITGHSQPLAQAKVLRARPVAPSRAGQGSRMRKVEESAHLAPLLAAPAQPERVALGVGLQGPVAPPRLYLLAQAARSSHGRYLRPPV